MKTKPVVKPVFILYLKISTSPADHNEHYQAVRKYLENTLVGYNVIVIPTYEGVTNSQAFYPSDYKVEKIENFVEEVAKKSAYKNIRIKFEKDE
jgi:hypothetical protein